MRTVFLFHDSFANPTSDWLPWAKVQLESAGYFVVALGFPTPAGQSRESWDVIFAPYKTKINNETLFIGHGTGALFALRVIESLVSPILGTVLVAPYARPLPHMGFQKASESFLVPDIDWSKIKANSGITSILYGTDDPFITSDESKFVAEQLGVSPLPIEGGGHLNRASGFDTFVQLISTVQELVAAKVIQDKARVEGAIQREKQVVEAVAEEKAVIETERKTGFRSMYQDIAKSMGTHSGSVMGEVLGKAHEDEIEKREQNPLRAKNLIYSILGGIFLLVGLAFLVYTTWKQSPQLAQIIGNKENITSVLRAEKHVRVDLAGKQSFEIPGILTAALEAKPIPGTVLDVYITSGNARVPFVGLMDLLQVQNFPLALRGYIEPEFMWGMYGAPESSIPFLVLRISSYDGTWSGLRAWESVMIRDLAPFFALPKDTTDIQTKWIWEDRLITNRPVRVLPFVTPGASLIETVTDGIADAVNDVVGGEVTTPPGPTIIAYVPDLSVPNEQNSIVSDPDITPPLSEAETVVSTPEQFNQSITEPVTYSYRDGDTVLVYTFLNEKTLLITTSDSIITEMLRRYADSQILGQ
ncbi:MAG: alpha/beta hydrolase [Candidatus Pacebacteria bacterium]|nr:alpha/beta hydrolase [Candidatus Paceibacterota bacterium]